MWESFLDDAFTHSVHSGWEGCFKSMNEQQFLKTLVSYGTMVFIFIRVRLGHWGKFYPWGLIISNMVERNLMA